MDKGAVLARLRDARAELLAAVDGLSTTEMGILPVDGTWTIKDILAHVSGWTAWDLAGTRRILAGQGVDWTAIQDVDAFNAHVVAARRNRTPEQILAEMMATHTALQELLADLPEEDLFSTGLFEGPYWDNLAGWLQVAWEHEAEHAGQIRAWRARRSPGLQRKGDPIPWLLERENPPARYRTLVDLLDRPADDANTQAAREAIPTYLPLAKLLAAQKKDGYWVKRDYYLPKYYGTFWVLTVLGDLGLDRSHEQIAKACEFMFTFQRAHGGFCRRRRVAGQGLVWVDEPGPCTQARIVRFLIQFGYGDDPRTRAGVGWLLANQREDGWWDCGRPVRPGCLRATIDLLRVAALDGEMAAQPAMERGAAIVADLLMEPGMGKYHVGLPWATLEYPYFDYGLIPAVEALARLGYRVEHPKVAAAIDYLLSRQLPGGGWPLDRERERLPLDVGQAGQANKWLTLDALRVIRLLGGSPGGDMEEASNYG
jgi:hypothetical protein